MKEENSHLTPNLANRIKGYRTLSKVLKQEDYLRQHTNASKFRISVYKRGSHCPHVPILRPHVPQWLPPIGNRHVNRSKVHRIHVSILHAQREEHGYVYGDVRHAMHLNPLQFQPHDLEIRIRRPENVRAGE